MFAKNNLFLVICLTLMISCANEKNMQIGDVYKTHADNTKLISLLNKKFYTSIDIGIKRFIDWYLNHHKK